MLCNNCNQSYRWPSPAAPSGAAWGASGQGWELWLHYDCISTDVQLAVLRGKRSLASSPVAEHKSIYLREGLTPEERALERTWLRSAEFQTAKEAGTPVAWRRGVPHYWLAPAAGQQWSSLRRFTDDSPPSGASSQ
jgi:hypothetical protein